MFDLFASQVPARGFAPLAAAQTAGAVVPRSGGRSFRRLGLMSALVRRAFSAQPADDPAGDYPPASDCWPMELVAGRGGNGFGFVHHAVDYVAGPTLLSPGKLQSDTDHGGSCA